MVGRDDDLLYRTNGGRYMNMNDPAHPWPEFPDFVPHFYASPPAVALSTIMCARWSARTNASPAPLSRRSGDHGWQLANEPRPGGSEAAGGLPIFYAWIAAPRG